MNPQIISVVNQIKGTYKTTTCIQLAKALFKSHKKVLVMDLDAVNVANNHEYHGVFNSKQNISKQTESGIITNNEFDLISYISLAMVIESNDQSIDNEFIITNLLKSIVKKYDYILIDCPAGTPNLYKNALLASNWLIVPIPIDQLSLRALEMLQQEVNEVNINYGNNLQILGILLIKHENSQQISQEIRIYITQILNLKIFNHTISYDSPSLKTTKLKKPVASVLQLEYLAFSEEFRKTIKAKLLIESSM